MKLLFSLILALLKLMAIDSTTSIGYINAAAYIPGNLTNATVVNGTCNQCICFAFFSNRSTNYQALNCYSNNNTCFLFTGLPSLSQLQVRTQSVYSFLRSTYHSTEATTVATSTAPRTTVYVAAATTTYFNDSRQNASTGHYWGCCKASCGWSANGPAPTPVKTCEADGVTAIDSNTQSVCANGNAYMCSNQQPWNVSETLAYAYVGVNIVGQAQADWCCACYSLIFTSGSVIGKEMIVQATNTAYISVNMFTLQIPGTGWFGDANGCATQFNGSFSWGTYQDGVSNRSDCNNLPTAFRNGCFWRFDWFLNANLPNVRFKEVPCPIILTANTGCIRP